jgi:hypothetical protein
MFTHFKKPKNTTLADKTCEKILKICGEIDGSNIAFGFIAVLIFKGVMK